MADESPSISLWKLMLNLSLSCLYPCLWSEAEIQKLSPLACGTSRAKLRNNISPLLFPSCLGAGQALSSDVGISSSCSTSFWKHSSFLQLLEQSHHLWSWGHMCALDSPQDPPLLYLQIPAHWYSAIYLPRCGFQKRTSYPTWKMTQSSM